MKKVLIIDDYKSHAQLLARRLAGLIDASCVVTAASGEEGVQAFLDDPEIVVVVCDRNMDPMDGEDVHNHIYRELSSRGGMFYFFSVDEDSEFLAQCRKLGANFIHKGAQGGYRAIAEMIVQELDK